MTISWPERWLLAKTFVVLFAYKSLLFVFPFNRFFKPAPPSSSTAPVLSEEKISRTVWAIRAISARAPLGFTCLVQALAAKWLLDNHPAIRVCIGVQKSRQQGFAAHAWVVYKDRIILGEQANQVFEPILHWN